MVVVEVTGEQVKNRAELNEEDKDAISGDDVIMEEKHAQIRAQSEFYGVAEYET